MSVLDERPIHRFRDPKYEMTLSVYPEEICGADLQKGDPLEITAEGTDPYELKKRTDELILSVMSSKGCGGKCLVEMLMTKDGRYYDRDECWVIVNPIDDTVKITGE